VLFGVRNYSQLATDTAPLAAASNAIFSSNVTLALFGGLLVGVGALISVAGSDESGMIGTSRLGYALAADGLFPKLFAKIHSKFNTPHFSIVIQSVTALIAAIVAPFVGGLSLLISISVFFLAIAYLATCASVFTLSKNSSQNNRFGKAKMLIPVVGIIFSAYLITQCTPTQLLIGIVLLFVGVPMYIKYSPKHELEDVKRAFLTEQNVLRRLYRQEHVFLASAIHHIAKILRRLRGKPEESEPL
jgi:amino acid transporter